MPDRRRWWLSDLMLLTIVCAIVYVAGAGVLGLTTWQEAQRAACAREMWRADEWVVPLINSQPYLAKPPLYYWAQMALTPLIAHEPTELVLHLVSAIFGTLGVLATYVMARLLIREGGGLLLAPPRPLTAMSAERTARAVAVLGALCLATGPGYVYGAHLGEIDIAQPVGVVLGAGGLGLAWLRHLRTGRLAWGAVAVGTLGGALAIMVKGLPALGVVLAGALGGVVLHAAYAGGAGLGVTPARWRTLAGALGALTTLPFTIPDIRDLRDAVGALMAAGIVWGVGVVVARMLHGARLALLARGVWSMQPWFSLGLPALAFAWWSSAVVARVGAEAVQRFKAEVESNLHVLIAKVPTLVAGDAVWSVGLGSVLGIVALAWLWRFKASVRPAGFLVLAWLLLGLAMFALLGKGVPRYLLPVWPAMAIAGGAAGIAWMHAGDAACRRVLLAVVLAALAVGEVAWYGVLRPRVHAHWSPRELIAELLGPEHGVRKEDLATFRIWTAAIDYYAGVRPMVVGDVNESDHSVGGTPLTEAQFVDHLRTTGQTRIVLARQNDRPDLIKSGRARTSVQRLQALGLEVEEIPTKAWYEADNGRSRVVVLRVRAPR